jgi:hypothetical protein
MAVAADSRSLPERRVWGNSRDAVKDRNWPILLKNSLSGLRRFFSFQEMQPKL